MSLDLSHLSFFQFDNLVRNRVPFLLLTEEMMPFNELFGPIERIHLGQWSFAVDFQKPADQILSVLEERKIPKEMPVVLLTKTGNGGQTWLAPLEQLGFQNVYWVPGGWDQLKSEAALG